MKTVLINEDCLHIWRSIRELDTPDVSTVTFLSNSKGSLVTQLFSIVSILGSMFGAVYRCYSMLIPFSGSKVQELKLKKELSKNLEGFDQTLLRRTSSNVWHTVSKLVMPFGETHFDCLSDSERVSVLFIQGNSIDLEGVSEEFDRFAQKFSEEDMLEVVRKYPTALVGKVFEDDTHAAFQLIGKTEVIDKVLRGIQVMNLEEIDRDQVPVFINRGEM